MPRNTAEHTSSHKATYGETDQPDHPSVQEILHSGLSHQKIASTLLEMKADPSYETDATFKDLQRGYNPTWHNSWAKELARFNPDHTSPVGEPPEDWRHALKAMCMAHEMTQSAKVQNQRDTTYFIQRTHAYDTNGVDPDAPRAQALTHSRQAIALAGHLAYIALRDGDQQQLAQAAGIISNAQNLSHKARTSEDFQENFTPHQPTQAHWNQQEIPDPQTLAQQLTHRNEETVNDLLAYGHPQRDEAVAFNARDLAEGQKLAAYHLLRDSALELRVNQPPDYQPNWNIRRELHEIQESALTSDLHNVSQNLGTAIAHGDATKECRLLTDYVRASAALDHATENLWHNPELKPTQAREILQARYPNANSSEELAAAYAAHVLKNAREILDSDGQKNPAHHLIAASIALQANYNAASASESLNGESLLIYDPSQDPWEQLAHAIELEPLYQPEAIERAIQEASEDPTSPPFLRASRQQ